MFGKYFKWTVKEYFRHLGPLFAACLVIEAVMLIRLSAANSTDVFIAEAMQIYSVLMIAMTVVVIISIVQNFWKDTYGKDAVFKMALPVTSGTRILAHACTSFLMALSAAVITFIPYIITIAVSVNQGGCSLSDNG
jgi:hypothetical protein